MNCSVENQIDHIIDNHCEYLMGKQNVVGVANCNKLVNGIDTGERCIGVFVEKKLPATQIDEEDMIPESYHGQQTDVIETGRFYARGFTSRVRPIPYGYSIGPAGVDIAGTLGGIVYDSKDYYILSCAHILAGENFINIGTPILQPAKPDRGVTPRDVIANLTKYVPIKFVSLGSYPQNLVDAGIAKTAYLNNLFYKGAAVFGRIAGVGTAVYNSPVKKSGRTSEYTIGRITSTNATLNIYYASSRYAVFTKQILTTGMAQFDGDSGSLLVDDYAKAVGLIFAGSTTMAVANPINTVLSSLGVKLLTT